MVKITGSRYTNTYAAAALSLVLAAASIPAAAVHQTRIAFGLAALSLFALLLTVIFRHMESRNG